MKNPQLCDQINSFSNCSQLSFSHFLTHEQKWCLNYTKFDDISLYSRHDISNDLSFQYKSIYVDEVYDIFRLIDRSKLILCCVTRQNANIKQSLMKEYKSQINFEKIKLVDLVKLLITNRKAIDSNLQQLGSSNSHFVNEVTSHIAELDELSNYCIDWQINEAEITNGFRLSPSVVDCILNDCGSDLSDLDKFIYNKFTDFDNKIKLTKNSQQSRPEKCRIERHCEQLLQLLSNDVCGALTTIGHILNRLIRGHCSSMVDVHYFRLTGDELKEYSVEISESQLHRVVGLKHCLLQIEQRVAENILVLKEWQLCPQKESNVGNVVIDCNGYALSPIRNSSGKSRNPSRLHNRTLFMASTPGPHISAGRQSTQLPIAQEQRELLKNLREKSLSSLDSGFLLTPDIDPSIEDSEDDFDIIPFSDDEYEKINDDDASSVFDHESFTGELLNKNTENVIVVADIIETKPNSFDACQYERALDLKQLCNQKKFCEINKTNKCLFMDQSVLEDTVPSDRVDKVLDLHYLPHFNLDNINAMKLSSNDKEVLQSQIQVLLIEENLALNFSVALRMAVHKAQQNPFDDMKNILEYMEQLLNSFNKSSPTGTAKNCKSNAGLDNQYNNSACTPFIIHKSNALRSCEQNTNNNADSKDDDSNERSVTQEFPVSNDDSLYLDEELRNAFKNILSDSTSADHNIDNSEGSSAGQFNDPKFKFYRDITVNVNDSSFDTSQSDWIEPLSTESDSSLPDVPRSTNESGLIEDIELVIKLSELHIRSEFQADEYYKATMTSDQNRIVDNYKNLMSQLENSTNNNNNLSNNRMESGDGDIESHRSISISPNVSKSHSFIKTDVKDVPTIPNHSNDPTTVDDKTTKRPHNESVVEHPFDTPENHNNGTEPSAFIPGMTKKVEEDISTNWSDRISLTIELTKKLLSISDYQLNLISSLFHKNSSSIKSSITRNKSFSISSLRQRLNITIKILSNLKHAIKTTYGLDLYEKSFSEINKLIDQSENLIQFSFFLQNWMKKNGCEIDKINCYNFEHELPDDLLIKMDPNDFEVVVLISTRRLRRTISALSRYPCYHYLMRLSLPIPYSLFTESLCLKSNDRNGRNQWELLETLFKLRRITAICALNIVDLHVLLTKIENDKASGFSEIENELKNLLIFWRAVDGECHRLLRCTSLVHHIMNDTRRCYIELVSLMAVMYSIMHTVELSNDESHIMKTNIETLMTYKQRILDWLGEVDLCISVIHKKRMTKKRFKFYDEIHNYLEENLSTISELSERIKDGCQQTVHTVTDVVTYCANLPNNSISEIGKFLTTNSVLDNQCLLSSGTNNEQLNETVFGAIIDLEKPQNNSANQLQDLLCKSKAIMKIIDQGNLDLVGPEEVNKDTVQDFSGCSDSKTDSSLKETISETATLNISAKISKIAACAATNALLLFVERCGFDFPAEKETEYQISSWTSSSDDDDIGNEVSSVIIEEVSTIMTSSIGRNILQLRNNRSLVASEIIRRDICREISDRTLQFMVEHIAMNREQDVELFLNDTSADITNYLCEELGCLMMESSLEELQFVGLRSNNNISTCMSTCQTKFERKLFQNLIEKSKLIVSKMSQSSSKSKDVEVDSFSIVSISPLDCMETVSVNSSKQTYDSNEVSQSCTKLFDSKSVIYNNYRPEMGFQTEVHPYNPRQTINRISKLVAQFSQNLVDSVDSKKSPQVKIILERISLNLLNIRSIQLVEEIATEAMKDAQFNYITPQNLEIPRSDRCSSLLVQKSTISGIIPQNPIGMSSLQIQSSEILSFSDTKRIFQMSFPVSIHGSVYRFSTPSKTSNVTKINESIARKLSLENIDSLLSISKSKDYEDDQEESGRCRDTDGNFSLSTTKKNVVHSDNSYVVRPKQSSPVALDFINFSENLVTTYEGESVAVTSFRSSFDKKEEHLISLGIEDGKCEVSRLAVPLETVPEVNIKDIVTGSAIELAGVDNSNSEIGLNVTGVNIFEGKISRESIDMREKSETGLKTIQSQNNNVFPSGSQIFFENDISVGRCTSRSRRALSTMWLFVIMGILFFLVVTYGSGPLCELCNYLRLSQSLYPKFTSNGRPF